MCTDLLGTCTYDGSLLHMTHCDCNDPLNYPGCIDTWHAGGDDGNGGWLDLYNQLADLYERMDAGEERIRLFDLITRRPDQQKRERAYIKIDRQLGEIIAQINASPPTNDQQRQAANDMIKTKLEDLIAHPP
jgi:hypothetical protein